MIEKFNLKIEQKMTMKSETHRPWPELCLLPRSKNNWKFN